MAKFPIERAKIIALAHAFMDGMPQNFGAFAGSPYTVAALTTSLDTAQTTASDRSAKQQLLDEAVAADQASIDGLVIQMKGIVDFARMHQPQYPDILTWIDYADSTTVANLVPGPVRAFEIVQQTPNFLGLDWKGPKVGTDVGKGEGGRVQFYEIVARQTAAQEWVVVKTEPTDRSQLTLPTAFAPYFPTGGTIEIGARAVNLKGPGPVSQTVSVKI